MRRKKIKIALVAAARPNFMKIAPIYRELNNHRDFFDSIVVHTGQHYDYGMSDSFFNHLNLPEPDVCLEVGSGTHGEQTSKVMERFEKFLLDKRPGLVMVVGDVNSTLACALAAVKLSIPVAHVEAGLRSFDRSMPEEINRIVTDSVSDYLFTTQEDADRNLEKEGISLGKIFLVGNVMIDSLLAFRGEAEKSAILERLGIDKEFEDYALLTLHRPSNVDDEEILRNILEGLREVALEIPVIFPIHPRTRRRVESFGFRESLIFHDLNTEDRIDVSKSINCVDPLGYLDFFRMMASAKFVLTDSGGIQEETTILQVPCLTLRENTERPVTIREGTNVLVGTEKKRIVEESRKILNGESKTGSIPKFWDGRAAQRIVKVLRENL